MPDGRHRMYGQRVTDPAQPGGVRVYLSHISSDGQAFAEEPGFRLTGRGMHAGKVVAMRTGGYRMHYTDQAQIVSGSAAATIRSAFSADGSTFSVESGARLTSVGPGSEAQGIAGPGVVALPDGNSGQPTDPFVGPQDPAAFGTPEGIRVAFGLCWGPNVIPETGI